MKGRGKDKVEPLIDPDNAKTNLRDISEVGERLSGGAVRDIIRSYGIPAYDLGAINIAKPLEAKDILKSLVTLSPAASAKHTHPGARASTPITYDVGLDPYYANPVEIVDISKSIEKLKEKLKTDELDKSIEDALKSDQKLMQYCEDKAKAANKSVLEGYDTVAEDLYRKNDNKNTLKPYSLILEQGALVNGTFLDISLEEAIATEHRFFEDQVKHGLLPTGVEADAARTFYINYNTGGHWITAEVQVGSFGTAGAKRQLNVNVFDSLGQQWTVYKNDYKNKNALPDSYVKDGKITYRFTGQQAEDNEKSKSTCGIRAAGNTVIMINTPTSVTPNLYPEDETILRARVEKSVRAYYKKQGIDVPEVVTPKTSPSNRHHTKAEEALRNNGAEKNQDDKRQKPKDVKDPDDKGVKTKHTKTKSKDEESEEAEEVLTEELEQLVQLTGNLRNDVRKIVNLPEKDRAIELKKLEQKESKLGEELVKLDNKIQAEQDKIDDANDSRKQKLPDNIKQAGILVDISLAKLEKAIKAFDGSGDATKALLSCFHTTKYFMQTLTSMLTGTKKQPEGVFQYGMKQRALRIGAHKEIARATHEKTVTEGERADVSKEKEYVTKVGENVARNLTPAQMKEAKQIADDLAKVWKQAEKDKEITDLKKRLSKLESEGKEGKKDDSAKDSAKPNKGKEADKDGYAAQYKRQQAEQRAKAREAGKTGFTGGPGIKA
jgi:hypothetical protein